MDGGGRGRAGEGRVGGGPFWHYLVIYCVCYGCRDGMFAIVIKLCALVKNVRESYYYGGTGQ